MSFSAQKNPNASEHKERWEPTPVRQWLWPITVMTFVLGMLISLALRSAAQGRPGGIPGASLLPTIQGTTTAYWQLKDTIYQLKDEIFKLQDDNNKLMSGSNLRAVTRDELKAARMAAGFTIVHGPGVVVTLNDSTNRPKAGIPAAMSTIENLDAIIHDVDVQRVVNELHIGGAENVAINDERLVANSAIRCVGPAILVNNDALTPPYRIRAIGNPATLEKTLELPGGIRDQLVQTDPAMISIAQSTDVTLPAYDGVADFKYSHVVDVADGRTKK